MIIAAPEIPAARKLRTTVDTMKGKSATLLVLVVAAVVLGCFAVKSYFEFQVTKLKHQYEQQGGQPASAGQANVGTAGAIPPPPGVAAAPAPAPTPSTVGVAPAPANTNLTAGAAPVPASAPVAPLTTTTPSPTTLANAVDLSEVARIKAELDALRRENALIEARASKAAGGAASNGSAAAAATPAPAGTLGGAPALPSDDPKVQALRQQILNASAIGKVVAYLTEFDRVAIEGGTERNIKVDDTFAVRRGHEIMGYLKVEEVDQGSCLAKLTSKNAESETARKPQAGDDVIKWPLF